MKLGRPPKELLLRRTLQEIDESNHRFVEPLDFARVINRFSPRNWHFSITCPNTEQVDINIYSEPHLTIDDFIIAIDGCIPKLLDSTTVLFIDNKSSCRALVREGERRSNVLPLSATKESAQPGITLVNFGNGNIPPNYSNPAYVTKYLHEHTWLGSKLLKREERRHIVKWKGLSPQEEEIAVKPRCSPNDEGEPTFEKEFPIKAEDGAQLGVGYLFISASAGKDSVKEYHSYLGPIDIPEAPELINRELLSRSVNSSKRVPINAYIEVQEKKLEYESDGKIGPWEKLCDVATAANLTTSNILGTTEYCQFLEEIKEKKKKEEADRLNLRISNAQNRPKIIVEGEQIGLLPTSEMEVVVMVAKLESLGVLPFAAFNIYEYTPREGIDALARLQINSIDVESPLAPVEMEHHFENYFQHGHPVEQTCMIVCWDFKYNTTVQKRFLEQERPGLYKFTQDGKLVWVLNLSECDGVSVEE